jgi:o-succinylbenzoate---CoA ligase
LFALAQRIGFSGPASGHPAGHPAGMALPPGAGVFGMTGDTTAAAGAAAVPADLPALLGPGLCWTHAALSERAAERAAELAAAGLQAGDVVLCPADDPLDLIVLQQALLRLGAGLLPHPAGLPAAEQAALADGVGAEWCWQRARLLPTGRRRAQAEADAAPTLLIRTSGSSGVPKFVMLTAAQLAASALRVNAALALAADEAWLCCLPLDHIGGLAIGWRCALAGAAMCLPHGDRRLAPGFDAAAVAAALSTHPVTHLSLVPTMLARLLDLLPAPPPSLKVLLLGGQALHPALARRAADAGWPLCVSYGMSETGSMVAVGRWRDDAATGARVGPLLPDVELDLDAVGDDAPHGRLRLRGPMLMAGYGNPARRPGVGLADGWLVTADLGRLDADGALCILGRADDLVIIGGEQVSPAAIEAKLAGAPGVGEVVVVAVPHPSWGATLVACWVGPATADTLAAWCRAELTPRERPRLFRQLDALPLLDSGKPDRRGLIERVKSERVKPKRVKFEG